MAVAVTDRGVGSDAAARGAAEGSCRVLTAIPKEERSVEDGDQQIDVVGLHRVDKAPVPRIDSCTPRLHRPRKVKRFLGRVRCGRNAPVAERSLGPVHLEQGTRPR